MDVDGWIELEEHTHKHAQCHDDFIIFIADTSVPGTLFLFL